MTINKFFDNINVSNLYKKYNIYLWASLASIVLTIIMLAYDQPFDVDGIQYLKTAEIFTQYGLKETLASAYVWPFYSILISFIGKVTQLSLLHSAYLLDTVLDTAAVIMFISLIKELGGSRKIQIISAFIILFYPYLNHYRGEILRGHGYYFFALLAILFLIRYFRSYQWRYAIGWGLAIIIATLFRIEGVVFACFLPLVILFKSDQRFVTKIKHLLQGYIVQIIILGLIIIYGIFISFSYHTSGYHISGHLGRLSEFTQQITHGLQDAWFNLQAKADFVKNKLPLSFSYRGETLYFIGGGLAAIYIGRLLSTFGLFYVILSIYAIVQKLLPSDWSAKAIWIWSILLNIIITAIFLSQQFFLSYRYIALLCLLLLMAVPFALERIYLNWKTHKPIPTGSRWIFPLVFLGLMYAAIGSVGHFGPSKTYIVKAGQWINNNIPTSAKLYSSDPQCFYYAHRQGLADPHGNNFYQQDWHKYDYIALKIPRYQDLYEKGFLNNPNFQEIKEFHNKRGDKLIILKYNATKSV